MRSLLLGAAIAALAAPVSSHAADTARPTKGRVGSATVSVTPLVAVPLTDWADSANIGVGGTIDFTYRLLDNLDATARGGYLYHFAKSDVTSSELPLLAGLQFHLTPYLYALGEAGLAMLSSSGGGASRHTNELAAAAGLGVDVGPVDVQAKVFFPTLTASGPTLYGILAGVEIPLLSL